MRPPRAWLVADSTWQPRYARTIDLSTWASNQIMALESDSQRPGVAAFVVRSSNTHSELDVPAEGLDLFRRVVPAVNWRREHRRG
jgi:hypothetical protein